MDEHFLAASVGLDNSIGNGVREKTPRPATQAVVLRTSSKIATFSTKLLSAGCGAPLHSPVFFKPYGDPAHTFRGRCSIALNQLVRVRGRG